MNKLKTNIVPLLVFAATLAVFTACGSFSRTAFNMENSTSIAALAAAEEWVLYYKAATNNPTLFNTSLDRLEKQRVAVDAAAHKVSVSLKVVERLRQQYTTNATMQPAVQAAISTLTDSFAGPNGLASLISEFVPTNWISKMPNFNFTPEKP